MKIEEIQSEIDNLRRIELQNQARLDVLQRELQLLTGGQPQPAPSQVPPYQQPQPAPSQVPPYRPTNPAPEKKTADMEKLIGKSWMGIMASALIFVSLIIFATLIIPMLTDTIKLVIMYVLSIGFLALGLVLLKRKNNAVNVAVSSCGLGALYLSMLLSDIYFHVIDDIILYLFIFVWAIGVAYLSKTKSHVFLIIGQIGIVLSVILGVTSCAETEDNMKLFILSLFFLFSAAVYELFNRDQKLLNISFHTVSFAILATYSVLADEIPYLTMVVLLAAIILQIANCAKSRVRFFAVFDILYVFFGLFIVTCLLEPLEIGYYGYSFMVYAIAAINIAVAHFLFREKMSNPNMTAISIFNACVMAVAFLDREPCLYILLVPLVLMILGFTLRDAAYKIESYAALVLVSINGLGERSVPASLLEIVFLVGVIVIAEMLPERLQDTDKKHKDWMKTVTFVFLHLSICKAVFTCGDGLRELTELDFSEDIEIAIIIALLLIVNLIFKFILNKKKEQSLTICSYVSSALLMMESTIQLYSISISSANYYITLLIAAAVFANNTYRFIRSRDKKYQLYGVIKVTAFLIIVLTSLQRATVLLSVALLVLSIIWILIGFGLSAKVIRLYGLVVTNISIIKLILIDITYNESLGKAVGFFVCGLLCFAISFIYSMIDRNLDKSAQE